MSNKSDDDDEDIAVEKITFDNLVNEAIARRMHEDLTRKRDELSEKLARNPMEFEAFDVIDKISRHLSGERLLQDDEEISQLLDFQIKERRRSADKIAPYIVELSEATYGPMVIVITFHE